MSTLLPTTTASASIVTIYTDGACKRNPGPGGWGCILLHGDQEQTFFGGEKQTTNNRMELMAAIEGLRALPQSSTVALYTDSKYVKDGISQWIHGWKKRNWRKADGKPVLNMDLWQQLDAEQQKHSVQWHWVKGHSNDKYNDRADLLANQGCDTVL